MPEFGRASLKKLNTCEPGIQLICHRVIKVIDFSVITGHRTKEEQNSLYPKFTKLKWPYGKHNSCPSKAIDIAPYILPYGAIFGGKEQILKIREYHDGRVSVAKIEDFILKSYARLVGHIERVAYDEGIKIRFGLDWDGDFDMLDQNFDDLGHWELL